MKFEFYPYVIIRSPYFPLRYITENLYDKIINDPEYIEALFISSPNFVHLLNEKKLSNKPDAEDVLLKYFNRMCFRCTPFGLFAGCSVTEWGNSTEIQVLNDHIQRRSRLDKDFLVKMIRYLALLKPVFLNLQFSLNNTFYSVGDEYRYIERIEGENGEMNYDIAAAEGSVIFQDFLGFVRGPAKTGSQILDLAVKAGYSKKTALNYLSELYKNQVVTTNMELSLPANELLDRCRLILKQIASNTNNSIAWYWHNCVTELVDSLQEIDNAATKSVMKYDRLFSLTERFPFNQPVNRVIQVDYSFTSPSGFINKNIQNTLSTGVNILSLINLAPTDNNSLVNFKNRFIQKYDSREVPFLIALDPESGIDYLEGTSSFDTFLHNEFSITTSGYSHQNHTLNTNHNFLIEKFEAASARDEKHIELTETDLSKMQKTEHELSATSTVFFRLFGDDQVQLDSVGGSSGINLFTRFSDFNASLNQITNEVAKIEQRYYEGKIVAEVIHEPEPRAGNVIAHPSFREFEIPYLSQGANGAAKTILLDDILISVVDNKVILRSKSLNKEIIPRLSHAYNYLKGSPIYRFLGDYQNNEKITGFQFDFAKVLPGKSFYPRLYYKNIVFFPATWIISVKDIEEKCGPLSLDTLADYLRLRKVNEKFIFSEGDNELLIVSSQPHLLNVFLKLLKKKHEVTIKEFLYDEKNYHILNENGEKINNQLLAILINKDKNSAHRKGSSPAFKQFEGIQRKFSIGSEWIYYKFYCGVYSADKILAGYILPLIKNLYKEKLISEAFFIRYLDPDSHLRIRFKVKKKDQIPAVMNWVHKYTADLETNDSIWKTQIDTYVRELERYYIGIEESESIFSFDSLAVIKLLNNPDIAEDLNFRVSAGIRLISDLLDCFDYTLDDKIEFTMKMKNALKAEFKFDVKADKKINMPYREKSHIYLYHMGETELNAIFKRRFKDIKKTCEKIRKNNKDGSTAQDLMKLLGSYTHMCVNRLFLCNQKIYEYIIYDYLNKYVNMLKNKPDKVI